MIALTVVGIVASVLLAVLISTQPQGRTSHAPHRNELPGLDQRRAGRRYRRGRPARHGRPGRGRVVSGSLATGGPLTTAATVPAEGPSFGARIRGWFAALDLARVLAASLFVAVVLFAVTLWNTVHPIAGALGLLVPFAVWYSALVRARAEAERQARMDEANARQRAPLTRPSLPTRAPLDEGGSVPAAPWRPPGGE